MTKFHDPGRKPAAAGRVFHYHLKKCGGTSLNAWLDTLSGAARVCDPLWNPGGSAARYFKSATNRDAPCKGRMVFYWSDVVHSHAPIRRDAPAGTFCFTWLRDPMRRLASQYADWRRLTDEDIAGYEEEVRACIASTRVLDLNAFLARHGEGVARFLTDNYMVRALASSRAGHQVADDAPLDDLLAEALQALHEDFDFIGVTDDYALSLEALCARLGVPPAGHVMRLNEGGMALDDPLLDAGAALRDRYCSHDMILYEAARRLFALRDRAAAEAYGLEAFEREHATALLVGLRGAWHEGAVRYSVRGPFYGRYLHQRDGGYDGNNAVWTQGGQRAAIYMPVPAGMRVTLLLWIRGYAAPEQRESLRVWVDGEERLPVLAPAQAYADVLQLPALTARDFVRLELQLAPQPDLSPEDTRPRGLAFDAYGWRPCP